MERSNAAVGLSNVEQVGGLPEPLSLTLLAPAPQCNQACPACFLTEVTREPVGRFDLRPEHYARFVSDFTLAGLPIRTVNFAGYEVTLPQSWPYVEAAFEVARTHGLRRSFVTNGMLLAKWTNRIEALDPHQISISLDGASPDENDRLRGLPGAFDATIHSVTRFLADAPRFRSRMAVASCLYDDANVASLMEMPARLAQLGVRRWTLSAEVTADRGDIGFRSPGQLSNWLDRLAHVAWEHDIEVRWIDLDTRPPFLPAGLQSIDVRSPETIIRLDPSGFIRSGEELMRVHDPASARRWNPSLESATAAAFGPRQTLRPIDRAASPVA